MVTGAAAPAPGTISLRFVARLKETGAEIPAGGFEVRLLALDPIRGETGGKPSGARTGPGHGIAVSVDAAPAPGIVRIEKAPPAASPAATSSAGASGGAPGPTYQGAPEQLLVTQPDGSTRTFLAGLKPGDYAMRITAKGRRMLLEILTVHPEDKLVERAMEPD